MAPHTHHLAIGEREIKKKKSLQVHCYATLWSAFAGMNALVKNYTTFASVCTNIPNSPGPLQTVIGFSKTRIIVASNQNERCSFQLSIQLAFVCTAFNQSSLLLVFLLFFLILFLFFTWSPMLFIESVHNGTVCIVFCFERE